MQNIQDLITDGLEILEYSVYETKDFSNYPKYAIHKGDVQKLLRWQDNVKDCFKENNRLDIMEDIERENCYDNFFTSVNIDAIKRRIDNLRKLV